jgi:Ni/Co efflux regulator RcnB/surface antigen
MKQMLTAVLALSLLNGTAVMAQPNNPNRTDQSDRNDQKGGDQKSNRAAPAAPRGQAARGRAAPAAPAGQAAPNRAAPTAPRGQAARGRAAPAAPTGQAAAPNRTAPTGSTRQAVRNRAAPVAPSSQAARNRAAPPTRGVPLENANPDLRNNPNVRVATPRWSRGDRLPDQYRQDRYVVSDWQQHGLRRPPGGYRWVRDDNNDFFLALIATGVIAEIAAREDRDQIWRQHYSRMYTYDDDVYYQECRASPDPAGIIAGALIGGLLGNAASRGNGGATIAGVIVGGAFGATLTRNLDCEDRSYAYKTYYDGFNSGRPGSRFEWNNPASGHRGEFLVGSYYNDPYGFRCANFTQTIYIQGRPQAGRGRACRQPDGAWAIVS